MFRKVKEYRFRTVVLCDTCGREMDDDVRCDVCRKHQCQRKSCFKGEVRPTDLEGYICTGCSKTYRYERVISLINNDTSRIICKKDKKEFKRRTP